MEAPLPTGRAAASAGPASCPLCDTARIGEEAYAAAFDLYGRAGARGLRSGAAEAVARREDLVGPGVSARQVWSHFAQHDRRQPRPPGNLKRGKALARAMDLSVRQREVLTMVGRLGVASAQAIWQVLYEDQLATDNAARAACYRELRPMVFGHMLYRARGPRSFGLAVRSEASLDGLTFLHPGRDLIPYMEDTEGFAPAITTDAREVGEHELREAHFASQLVVALRRELYRDAPDVGSSADMRIAPANWFGAVQSTIWFAHPTRGTTERVTPDGLAAISLRVPARGVDTLLPFFYLNDPGYLPIEALVERIVLFGGLGLSAAAGRRFPALGAHTPPLVVVCSSARRLSTLLGAAGARLAGLSAPERPQVLASDRVSAAGRAFSERVFSPLDAGADPSARVSLLRGLLEASGQGPAQAGLSADTIIAADMAGASRQR